jgi:hypothetical protein
MQLAAFVAFLEDAKANSNEYGGYEDDDSVRPIERCNAEDFRL